MRRWHRDHSLDQIEPPLLPPSRPALSPRRWGGWKSVYMVSQRLLSGLFVQGNAKGQENLVIRNSLFDIRYSAGVSYTLGQRVGAGEGRQTGQQKDILLSLQGGDYLWLEL